MVGSIKNYTYNDGGIDKQPVNIHQSISTILTLLKPKLLAGGIEVDVQFEAKDNTVLGFAGQLTQVFTNLIDNAIDALATTKDPKLTLKTHSNDTYYMISVIDNGPGIPEELQELVFDTFFTTKDINKGSGMGLDIVRRIVENHQAELILNSKPGYTEFLVRFLLQP